MEIITKVSTPTGTQYQCFLSEAELNIILFGGSPYENKDVEFKATELFSKLNKGYTDRMLWDKYEDTGCSWWHCEVCNPPRRWSDKLKSCGCAQCDNVREKYFNKTIK